MSNLQENGSIYMEAGARHREWETSGHPIGPGADSPKCMDQRRPKEESHLRTRAAFSIPHTHLMSPPAHSGSNGFYRGQGVLLMGVLPSSSSHLLIATSIHRETLHPNTTPHPHIHILTRDTSSCLWTPHISTAELLTPGNPSPPTKEKSYMN